MPHAKRPTKAIIDNWKHMVQLIDKMNTTMLEMLRHPDCTPEQVLAIQKQYRDVYKEHIEMRKRLRAAFPSSYGLVQYPWEVRH